MCKNEFILTLSCLQVSMAQYGFDVPCQCSKKPVDAIRHHIIFDIVS